ncbi:LysR family transcriptional regulator [Ureibacillus sp. FSL K6-8385]|uniref:LysR family transcriptional regulator n=1 Tax=Ureibacillus terrenus TaxID=118246 RepID=A0A540V373_9BACL|nr:LysR family transcriptional regulator [Ureibacillus terrenus]MED3662733.1 LysR family transcriptional regulator [Ureibacillus terrenus]MED3763680.1 LysR family transcriptional regulator [Ureibacillus terrenus]TQE91189.1 LysR family transcriptional regulator [Ureibacillus terrenus]
MNTDQLEAFIYVVELKSIHKASKALYLSQPTVTARIKALERELNTELFIRQGKQLILNQQGKEFIPYAQQILKTFREGKSNIRNKRDHNEIVFGANFITSSYFIPHALVLWKKENPDFNFKFITGTNEELIVKLLNHEIDFAFTKPFSNDNIIQEVALDNSIQLVVYPEHPYVLGEEVTIKKLAKEPIVFFECGAFDWNLIYKIFELENVEPKVEFKVDQLEVAKSLIKNKQGIGFLPLISIKEEIERKELIVVKSLDLFTITQPVYLSYVQSDVVNILKSSIQRSIDRFNNFKCLV